MFRVPNGFLGYYKRLYQNDEFCIKNLFKALNAFSIKYDKIILMDDFNLTITKPFDPKKSHFVACKFSKIQRALI